jgi:phosphoglycolate phosphatase
MDLARYEDVFTFPVIDYYRRLGFDFDATPFTEVGTTFIQGYQARQHECRLQDGALAAFDALAARGVPMSVLSASLKSRLDAQAAHHGITGRFVRLLGLDHHYADGKVELGRAWMKELGVPPAEVLLVGDTDHDFHVAQDLGVACVLVPSGHQSRARLERCGAPLLKSLNELPGRLAEGAPLATR